MAKFECLFLHFIQNKIKNICSIIVYLVTKFNCQLGYDWNVWTVEFQLK